MGGAESGGEGAEAGADVTTTDSEQQQMPSSEQEELLGTAASGTGEAAVGPGMEEDKVLPSSTEIFD